MWRITSHMTDKRIQINFWLLSNGGEMQVRRCDKRWKRKSILKDSQECVLQSWLKLTFTNYRYNSTVLKSVSYAQYVQGNLTLFLRILSLFIVPPYSNSWLVSVPSPVESSLLPGRFVFQTFSPILCSLVLRKQQSVVLTYIQIIKITKNFNSLL